MTSFQLSSRCQTSHAGIIRRPLSRFAGCAVLAFGVTMQCLPVFAEGISANGGLAATPLVLKDGRIARVSVHTIPFPEDAAALASVTASELDIFTQTMATDCFLTAQVIGHVDKKETSGRDTVDIHRLARARADTIQDKLIANGLPAASIASVWDWQFMVQDARATLWVFRLSVGEDCEDKSLSPVNSGQVADALSDDGAGQVAATAEHLETKQLPKKQAESAQQQVVAAAKTKTAPEVTKPIPASLPKPTTVNGQASRPAAAPSSQVADPAQLSALNPEQQKADKEGQVTMTEKGTLEITFATNSSYFPQGWNEPLQAFLDGLDKGKSYIVRIHTSIDGGTSVAGTSSEDEAARYNRWLADRRFERVKSWLEKNNDASTLQIEPVDVSDDGSRRVVIELNPLG